MSIRFGIWIIGVLSCFACTLQSGNSTGITPSPSAIDVDADSLFFPVPTFDKDSTIQLLFSEYPITVTLLYPSHDEFKGTILALPGWNYPSTDWCDSTTLCHLADSLGYIIVLPEMGKSIYCRTTYPETRKDWLRYPTRQWISEKMISSLQNDFGILLEDQPNYIVGLSTGARGAALLALDHPTIFNACALLSGDYDQTGYPTDNLYKGYYGAKHLFSSRWKNEDNIITHIADFKVPAYIGHGKKDRVVPIQHSEQLVKALKLVNVTSIFHIDETAGHDYLFWNSEVKTVIDFFSEH